MCISVVEPAALWLSVWVQAVEKGPSSDLWTELGRRRNGGLEREKDKFHLDLMGEVNEITVLYDNMTEVCLLPNKPGLICHKILSIFFWEGANSWMPEFRPWLVPGPLRVPTCTSQALCHQGSAAVPNLFFFNWSTVDLQCVHFCCTAKWFSYTYVYSFFIFFSIMVYHRILNIVSCAIQ